MCTVDIATSYLQSGLGVLPAILEEKRPALPGWKQYQRRLPTERQVRTWFADEVPFCLLAGFGWLRLSGPEGRLSLKPVWLSVAFAFLSGAFLTLKAHDFVRPYARAYQMAKSVDADIVLVDTRGGVFIQDIIRVEGGALSRPILMDLDFVKHRTLKPLCDRYKVRIFDHTHFLPLGVPPAAMSHRWSKGREMKREYLAAIGCGQEPLRFTRSDWR